MDQHFVLTFYGLDCQHIISTPRWLTLRRVEFLNFAIECFRENKKIRKNGFVCSYRAQV